MVILPPLLWLVIVSRYPFRYGLKGLWVLVGAPLAFYNVASVAIWMWGCSHHPTINTCP
jgi:hypothetical protein